MSQENVELLYRAYDALNQRNIDAMLALSDPDVEFTPLLLELEGGGPYRGHDGVRRWWEDLLGVFPDFSSKIEEVRDLGDVTAARLRMGAHHAESDAPVEETIWLVVEWHHNKVIWWRTFRSQAEALEAAGLSE
jgi:ketosteroid isomerase-like protein